MKVILETRRMN